MISANSDEEFQDVLVKTKFNRLMIWKGRDSFHQDVAVQVRLDDDESISVFLQKYQSKLHHSKVTIEELYDCLLEMINRKTKGR